jgi:hypothetical protein
MRIDAKGKGQVEDHVLASLQIGRRGQDAMVADKDARCICGLLLSYRRRPALPPPQTGGLELGRDRQLVHRQWWGSLWEAGLPDPTTPRGGGRGIGAMFLAGRERG